MMLCLALRSSPERVYQRALTKFTVAEISEAFAAARGLALPSQLRNMIRAQGRDLHAEFVRLLPTPPQPISIQRWSFRRVMLWVGLLLVLVLATQNPDAFFNPAMVSRTPLHISDLDCGHLRPLWLTAQAVPSASRVPCVRSRMDGWTVTDVAVNDGRSVATLMHDRAGMNAVELELTAACDPGGASEVAAPEPGVRRFKQVERGVTGYAATWYDRFDGGCVTYRLRSGSDSAGKFAEEASQLLGFTSRASLRQALDDRSGGRLRLDPGTAP